ncbi:MAG: deoxyhypusine synthase family protein [Candidatus Omnitrophica bacterium]|nr:deoxyhypusine synthase family protein [Candidatus Omnitrophota bacterium]
MKSTVRDNDQSVLDSVYLEKKLTSKERAAKEELLSQPICPIAVSDVNSIVSLVDSFRHMSIQARLIGRCAEVYENMLTDKARPTILLGLAGPLIAGGLRKVIRDMIEAGIVDAVVSTGAILYQDLYQALGHKHTIGTPDADDARLHELRINRIYDTYVDDEKFVETDGWVRNFAGTLKPKAYSSREFLSLMGSKITDDESILKKAAEYGIPVFSPALNDSSIGIGLTDHYHIKRKKNLPKITIDAIRDNYELTQIMVKSKRTAAIYIAGGVPKNFINDAVVMSYVFGRDTGGHSYAFQLTTDVPHWGGLSGSTLDEAKSWGKVAVKAKRAMAFVEPTVSLPLVAGYVIQKGLGKNRPRLKFTWKEDILESLRIENDPAH